MTIWGEFYAIVKETLWSGIPNKTYSSRSSLVGHHERVLLHLFSKGSLGIQTPAEVRYLDPSNMYKTPNLRRYFIGCLGDRQTLITHDQCVIQCCRANVWGLRCQSFWYMSLILVISVLHLLVCHARGHFANAFCWILGVFSLKMSQKKMVE